MNSARSIRKNDVIPLRQKKIDRLCEEIARSFDTGKNSDICDLVEEMFSCLPPTATAMLYNYLLEHPSIKAKTGLTDLIETTFSNRWKKPDRPDRERRDPEFLLTALEKKEQVIDALRKEVKQLKNELDRIRIGHESVENILSMLKRRQVALWKNRTASDPQNPLDFYQHHYKKYDNYMYQFILRKYDPFLIKAMDGKVAYLRKKGKTVTLKDFIPPKKQKTVSQKPHF